MLYLVALANEAAGWAMTRRNMRTAGASGDTGKPMELYAVS